MDKIFITISGISVALTDLQNEVNGAMRKGVGNTRYFSLHTVQGLIDKINELTKVDEPIDTGEMTSTFKNGDMLSLTLKDVTFAGYNPAKIYEITYGEQHAGKYDDDFIEPTPGEHYFMALNTEYFPEKEKEKAILAFGKRAMSKDPVRESGMGYCLDDFLEKKK
jgi:hypothetical protein